MQEKVRKKILQIGYQSLAKAGIQSVIMNIARGVYNEFEIDVLLTSNKEGYYDNEYMKYGKIYRINSSLEGYGTIRKYISYVARPFKQFFYAYKLIKVNEYDIVHIHSGLEGGPMFLAAKFAGVKHIIAHSHNSFSPEKRTIFSKIYRNISKRIIHCYATKRIGVSSEANKYLYGDDDCFVIDNPVDIDRFSKSINTRKKGGIILSNVGRYCYQKNQLFLLEIVKEFLRKDYNVQLKLVGFGEDEKILRKKTIEYKLEHNVQLIPGNGEVDISEILKESDVFVFPSRFEGLGIVLIEAQAAGCLCIASDVVPKETDLGLCEYISLNENVEEWVKRIINMINKRGEYLLDSERIKQYKVEYFQQRILNLYNEL